LRLTQRNTAIADLESSLFRQDRQKLPRPTQLFPVKAHLLTPSIGHKIRVINQFTLLTGSSTNYNAAEGGEIFPRRVGGIMPNEGIPGQDSVRAMLMPGEFVMTTNAVKGLGGGNMRQGINNMYDMMRGLESRGKAMA
jgi:hypothetical protein